MKWNDWDDWERSEAQVNCEMTVSKKTIIAQDFQLDGGNNSDSHHY